MNGGVRGRGHRWFLMKEHNERPLGEGADEVGDDTLKSHTVLYLAFLSQVKRVRVRNEVNLGAPG